MHAFIDGSSGDNVVPENGNTCALSAVISHLNPTLLLTDCLFFCVLGLCSFGADIYARDILHSVFCTHTIALHMRADPLPLT